MPKTLSSATAAEKKGAIMEATRKGNGGGSGSRGSDKTQQHAPIKKSLGNQTHPTTTHHPLITPLAQQPLKRHPELQIYAIIFINSPPCMRRADQYENAPLQENTKFVGNSRRQPLEKHWMLWKEGRAGGWLAENGDPQTDCRPQAPLVPSNGEE